MYDYIVNNKKKCVIAEHFVLCPAWKCFYVFWLVDFSSFFFKCVSLEFFHMANCQFSWFSHTISMDGGSIFLNINNEQWLIFCVWWWFWIFHKKKRRKKDGWIEHYSSNLYNDIGIIINAYHNTYHNTYRNTYHNTYHDIYPKYFAFIFFLNAWTLSNFFLLKNETQENMIFGYLFFFCQLKLCFMK